MDLIGVSDTPRFSVTSTTRHTVFRGLDWTGLDWTSKTRTCKTRTQNL